MSRRRDPQKVATAARAIAEGGSVSAAASAAGVTERTVYAWRSAGLLERHDLPPDLDALDTEFTVQRCDQDEHELGDLDRDDDVLAVRRTAALERARAQAARAAADRHRAESELNEAEEERRQHAARAEASVATPTSQPEPPGLAGTARERTERERLRIAAWRRREVTELAQNQIPAGLPHDENIAAIRALERLVEDCARAHPPTISAAQRVLLEPLAPLRRRESVPRDCDIAKSAYDDEFRRLRILDRDRPDDRLIADQLRTMVLAAIEPPAVAGRRLAADLHQRLTDRDQHVRRGVAMFVARASERGLDALAILIAESSVRVRLHGAWPDGNIEEIVEAALQPLVRKDEEARRRARWARALRSLEAAWTRARNAALDALPRRRRGAARSRLPYSAPGAVKDALRVALHERDAAAPFADVVERVVLEALRLRVQLLAGSDDASVR